MLEIDNLDYIIAGVFFNFLKIVYNIRLFIFRLKYSLWNIIIKSIIKNFYLLFIILKNGAPSLEALLNLFELLRIIKTLKIL